MKKHFHIFVVALCVVAGWVSTPLAAQHYIGVRAGYGGGSVRVFPAEENGLTWGLYSGGVSWKYYSHDRFVGGVQVDVEYFQRAMKRELTYARLPDDTTTTYTRYINSVMVPLIWQPHLYFFGRSMRVYMNFGLTFSYNINSYYEWRSEIYAPYGEPVNLLERGNYEMRLTRDNRFGYGLMGGAGIGYLLGRFEFQVEARYYFGYSDILRNRNIYEENPLRSPLDNINVSVGVYYRLGRGGILSPPGKNAAEKIRQREERRAARREPFLQGDVVIDHPESAIDPETGRPFPPQGAPIRIEDLPNPSTIEIE